MIAGWMSSGCRWMVFGEFVCALAGGGCRAFKACLACESEVVIYARKVEVIGWSERPQEEHLISRKLALNEGNDTFCQCMHRELLELCYIDDFA
jgi:hypothetical protein